MNTRTGGGGGLFTRVSQVQLPPVSGTLQYKGGLPLVSGGSTSQDDDDDDDDADQESSFQGRSGRV